VHLFLSIYSEVSELDAQSILGHRSLDTPWESLGMKDLRPSEDLLNQSLQCNKVPR
jgi:hypothetical protein